MRVSWTAVVCPRRPDSFHAFCPGRRHSENRRRTLRSALVAHAFTDLVQGERFSDQSCVTRNPEVCWRDADFRVLIQSGAAQLPVGRRSWSLASAGAFLVRYLSRVPPVTGCPLTRGPADVLHYATTQITIRNKLGQR